METIICRHCGAVDDYRTSNAGPHIKAECNQCGQYIKFLPQHSEPICYIGKYRGVPFSQITDKSWLRWCLSNVDLTTKHKDQFTARLNQLT